MGIKINQLLAENVSDDINKSMYKPIIINDKTIKYWFQFIDKNKRDTIGFQILRDILYSESQTATIPQAAVLRGLERGIKVPYTPKN